MTEQQPTPEEVESTCQRLEVRIQGLKEQNNNMRREVQSAGADIDVATARVERFIHFLVENGALTHYQRLIEQEQWEMHLRGQLQQIVGQVRALANAAGRDVQTGSGLIIPGKKS